LKISFYSETLANVMSDTINRTSNIFVFPFDLCNSKGKSALIALAKLNYCL